MKNQTILFHVSFIPNRFLSHQLHYKISAKFIPSKARRETSYKQKHYWFRKHLSLSRCGFHYPNGPVWPYQKAAERQTRWPIMVETGVGYGNVASSRSTGLHSLRNCVWLSLIPNCLGKWLSGCVPDQTWREFLEDTFLRPNQVDKFCWSTNSN